MRITLIVAVGLLLWIGGEFSDGQAEPLKLSYADALKTAAGQNPQVQTAKLEIDKAKALIGEAYASALPTLSASGLYKRNFIAPEMVTDLPPEFGGGTMKFKFERDNYLFGSLDLVQPLYVAGKVGLALQIAKLYRKVSEEKLKNAEIETQQQVAQAYFGVVLAQEWERVTSETYQQMQDHLKQVEALHREGMVSQYDLIRSQVQVSNFYPQVVNAENSRRVAHEALRITLGMPLEQDFELSDSFDAYPLTDVGESELYTQAVKQRSEIQQLDLQSKMLGKLETIERHGVWWPTLALVGQYSIQAQEDEFDFDDYYWIRGLYGGISISVPLFDGFRAKHRVQQVQADLNLLNVQREHLLKGINLEITDSQSKLREALKNVTAQEEGVKLARTGFDIAEVRYQNGLATQLEVMDAQLALNQARLNELIARYDSITAHAALLKALGRK